MKEIIIDGKKIYINDEDIDDCETGIDYYTYIKSKENIDNTKVININNEDKENE